MRKPGKKIDVLEILHGAYKHKVELRLDKETGKFTAELGSEGFESGDLAELKKQLQAKAEQMASYEFRWYIDINLRFSAGQHRSSWHVDFEKLEPDQMYGLNFNFSVYERSQLIESGERDYAGRKTMCRLERQLTEINGKLVPEDQGHGSTARANRGEGEGFRRVYIINGEDDDSIEYTPERYAKLKAIRAGLYELARRLHVVIGDGQKSAAALDGSPLLQLLPLNGGTR